MFIFQATAGCSIVVLIPHIHNLQKIKNSSKAWIQPTGVHRHLLLAWDCSRNGFLLPLRRPIHHREAVWNSVEGLRGICKIMMRMFFIAGDCLGVFWQRDQSNLFHLRSSLPQQDPQKDPLDLGGDDVRCARSLSLREPLLCKGDKTPMCNRTKDVLEANLQ